MTLPIPLVTTPRRRDRPPPTARPPPDPDPPARPGARHPARPRPPARPAGRPLRPVAAQRRRRPGRPGRGRRRGQLHRPVPDGRSRPRTSPPIAALEAAIPDAAALVFACLGIALALHGRRALRARALNLAAGRHQRVHERDRGRARLAEPGHLGPAPGRLRPGQRHADRRRPRLGHRPPPPPGTALAAERPPRWPSSAAWPCGCCAWPWPRPPPWPGSAPGCSRNARSPPAAAPLAGPAPHPGRAGGAGRSREGDQDRPVPGPGHRTARASRLHPAGSRRRDQRRPGAPRSACNPGAARAALRKAVLAAQNGDPR